MVAIGLTEMLVPVNPPGIHIYLSVPVPPEAFALMVTSSPKQMVASSLADMVIAGGVPMITSSITWQSLSSVTDTK